MKYSLIAFGFILLMLGCNSKNNQTEKSATTSNKISTGFILRGELINGKATTVYLNKIIGNTLYQIDSAQIVNNLFKIQGVVEYPERFTITFDVYPDNTLLIIENHYLGAVLERNQFDTFYHEHPRTYSLNSFYHIAKKLGREVINHEFPSRYGGNIRVVIGKGTSLDASEVFSKEANFSSDFKKMNNDIATWKIEKQKEFLRGNIKKSKVSQTESKQLQSIEEAGAEMKVVAQDYYGNGGSFKGIECVVVKKMTRTLMEQESFPLTSKRYRSGNEDTLYDQYSKEVAEGIRIGTLLGKKMQVRGESRETIFNRQLVGKMDKRMVSSLGYGNEHVFFTREIDSFKKANLHISVDASGSMGGDKWRKTMINVVALAKAVDMIPNLNIQISFRTTTGELPYIVLAYDSRVDKFVKVKQLFGYLGASGTTPEGLCFEAIMKQMVGSNSDVDSYFLNISDGEPYFHGKGMSYQGSGAAKHTRKMMKSIEGMGIKVMSYYVTDSNYEVDEHSSSSAKIFKECYGPAASYINVTNVNEVARTMNRLFMNKKCVLLFFVYPLALFFSGPWVEFIY